uniref:8 kDa Amblyomma family member n=1 Tax=Rhipicephalus zambeziensis TaxID=60191 RepID=A0A224Y714_9ACAR
MSSRKAVIFLFFALTSIMMVNDTYGVPRLLYCKKTCVRGSTNPEDQCPKKCHCVVKDNKNSTGHCWILPEADLEEMKRKKKL